MRPWQWTPMSTSGLARRCTIASLGHSKRAVGKARCFASRTDTWTGSGIRSPFPVRTRRTRRIGACRLLADGVDIRTIQLMLGHADIKQTRRYLNITDEELRKAMTGVSERRRQLKAVGQ